MIHYHGTPITPRSVLHTLTGKHFCVSYADPRDIEICHQIGQSVMIDSGAYTAWTRGTTVDWEAFAQWARPWIDYQTTWVVMPDVINGSEQENNWLSSWLFNHDRTLWRRSAPVWHMHESIKHLKYLCLAHDRVCIGSSGIYATPGSTPWRNRMNEAMTAICQNGTAPTQLHMLRAMSHTAGNDWPISSADSTNLARNHHRPGRTARELADQIDAIQTPGRWRHPHTQLELD